MIVAGLSGDPNPVLGNKQHQNVFTVIPSLRWAHKQPVVDKYAHVSLQSSSPLSLCWPT